VPKLFAGRFSCVVYQEI